MLISLFWEQPHSISESYKEVNKGQNTFTSGLCETSSMRFISSKQSKAFDPPCNIFALDKVPLSQTYSFSGSVKKIKIFFGYVNLHVHYWKFENIYLKNSLYAFVYIKYPEKFAFLILRILELFAREICRFVKK